VRRPRAIDARVALFAARTPTLPPATHTNSYALGSREVLLVEPATPYPREQRAWADWARSLAAAGRRVVAIVLTHHHADHVGGAGVLARELGLPIWAHAETAARVDVPVGRRLEDGEEVVLQGPAPERWTVLHTPGHAPGHLCLWDAETGTLVAGDMVASQGTILVAPGDGDMRLYVEQLGRLRALGPTLALPAHGEPIDDPMGVLARYIAHRIAREAKVLVAVGKRGPAGARVEDLVADAYDDAPVTAWGLALLSLRAHLEKLVAEGRVVAVGERFAARALDEAQERKTVWG
jgi:glyoxylase-like metal-dependent hydrolase (beta-lactamase superfamily II)